MPRKRLLWQLYPAYVLIALVALVVVTWEATGFFHSFYLKELKSGLRSRANLVSSLVTPSLLAGDTDAVDALCKVEGPHTNTRITVILPSGQVVGDSDRAREHMENHRSRPEVAAALRTGVGSAQHYSKSVKKEMLYVAVAIRRPASTLGVVRLAVPLTAIHSALRATRLRLTVAGVLIAIAVALVTLFITRRITRPLEEIKRGAERFARGDLETRLPVCQTEEIASLAETMNQMAARLDERIRSAMRQSNEQEAVFSGMLEGVFAVDNDERVMKLNEAAARLFGVDAALARGRSIYEVVRNTDLQRFVAQLLATQQPQEGDVLLRNAGDRYMQVHGTILNDESGRGIGAVIVLNDVTNLRRLENLRRDFVANVSHELKTPITSIKGFAETLLDGAMHNPEDAKRFLQIIAKHAGRLETIIEDLLSLSRLEQETDKAGIIREDTPIAEVLTAAVLACERAAATKNIHVEASCAPDLTACVNPTLLEQAVVNLIDNAIKYSEAGSRVTVTAARAASAITLRVQDQGSGIAPEHLSRLFERFYRVDKGRSRKMGGTGLGLAIVKHIAQAHGGQVLVESAVGRGSTFTIQLPATLTDADQA